MTEFIVKSSKVKFLTVYHFSFSQYFLDVKPRVMQAVIAKYFFNKNGGSIPVCTERKATGEYVLACFLSATMVSWLSYKLFTNTKVIFKLFFGLNNLNLTQ